MKKKVIVIGAGIGGLAAALRLLKNGYEVIIYEKNEKVGGRVNLIETENYRFDLSASILMMPDAYKEIFAYVNKNYANYIEFIKIDPVYRLFSADSPTMDFSTDITSLTRTLEKSSKEDSIGFYKFMAVVYEKYLTANQYFLQVPQDNFMDFFNLETLSKVFKIDTLTTSYDFISKYIKNEKIRDYLAFQSMYVGISPFDGPNIYTLVPAVSQLYGLWHLKGGMYSFVEALSNLITEFGGTIKTKVNVQEILFAEDKAVGIKTENGTENADFVVCNADFPYAMKNLIKNDSFKDEYTDKKLSEMKYSCSTFIIYLGLKKQYPQLSIHNIYLGKNFKQSIESAFTGTLPEHPSLYIYCPTRIDRSMVNNDGECVNIILRVPNLFFQDIVWDEDMKQLLAKKIFDELKNIKGLEDIEDNIQYIEFFTPIDMECNFNAYGGTAFGLSTSLTQTNYFRPHIKSKKVNNLFFVGNSTHPGPGISLVLNSSKLLAEEILKMD